MIPAHENAECLTDIMARVEQLALASAEERNPLSPLRFPRSKAPWCSIPLLLSLRSPNTSRLKPSWK